MIAIEFDFSTYILTSGMVIHRPFAQKSMGTRLLPHVDLIEVCLVIGAAPDEVGVTFRPSSESLDPKIPATLWKVETIVEVVRTLGVMGIHVSCRTSEGQLEPGGA